MKVNQITNSSQFQVKRSENNAKSVPAMKLNTLQQDTVSFSGGKTEAATKAAKKTITEAKDSMKEFAKIADDMELANYVEGNPYLDHLKFRDVFA